jgi:hypothetical protein
VTSAPGVSRPIAHHEFHTSTSDALRMRLDRLGELLSLRGLCIPPGSRFDSYRRLLADPNPTVPALHQALLECEQVCLIMSTIGQDQPPLGYDEKLKTVLSGPLLPSVDHAASPERDHQFELFVAALSHSAGYKVDLVEPDLRLDRSGQPGFVIAAKRLKSPSKLRRNVRKASKQIAALRQHGVVALDITKLLQQPDEPMVAHDLTAASFRASQLIDTFRNANIMSIRSYCDLTWVFGAQLFFAGLAQLQKAPFLAMVWLVRTINLCAHDDARCETLALYAQALVANPPVGPHMEQWRLGDSS